MSYARNALKKLKKSQAEAEVSAEDLKYRKEIKRKIKNGILPAYMFVKENRPYRAGEAEYERLESKGVKKFYRRSDNNEIIPFKGGLTLKMVSTFKYLTKKEA